MKTRDFGKFNGAAVLQATQSCVNTSDLKAVQISPTEAAVHLKMMTANTADV